MRRRFATAILRPAQTPANADLKAAIFQTGLPQFEIAARLGMAASRLSRIVRGHAAPTEEEQEAMARLLKRPRRSLFRSIAS